MKKSILFLMISFFSSNIVSQTMDWKAYIDKDQVNNHSTFYEFGVNEYRCANYGTSKEVLEKLCLRTDEYPNSYYYIAQVYRLIKKYKNKNLYKTNLLTFVSSKKDRDKNLEQQAYCELALLEEDPNQSFEYAKQAMKLGNNKISLEAMKTAYTKMYNKTGDIKFASLKQDPK